MVGAEEDRYDNILLCLELLSHLCSRDFFSFDEPDSFEDSSSKLVLIGLDIIVPHIDVGECYVSYNHVKRLFIPQNVWSPCL